MQVSTRRCLQIYVMRILSLGFNPSKLTFPREALPNLTEPASTKSYSELTVIIAANGRTRKRIIVESGLRLLVNTAIWPGSVISIPSLDLTPVMTSFG
jgi:hypothetical protein